MGAVSQAQAGNQQFSLVDADDSSSSLVKGFSNFSPENIILNAKQGNAFAEEIVNDVIENISQGLSSILNIFEPEILVIGGSVAWGLEHRFNEIIKTVSHTALPRYRKNVPIKYTTLGEEVSILGAAQLIFKNTK